MWHKTYEIKKGEKAKVKDILKKMPTNTMVSICPCAGGRPIYGRVCEFQYNAEISNKDVTKYVLAGNFSAIIVK